MIKIGQWEIEEEELDQQHLEAQQRGDEQLQTEPQACSVTYDQPKAQFVIELKSGVTVLLPTHLLQGLDRATPAALAEVQLGPRGASLHWEALGVSFSLVGLLAGVFGTRVWMQEMGRRGGNATAAAKAAAARLNGKKGGVRRKWRCHRKRLDSNHMHLHAKISQLGVTNVLFYRHLPLSPVPLALDNRIHL